MAAALLPAADWLTLELRPRVICACAQAMMVISAERIAPTSAQGAGGGLHTAVLAGGRKSKTTAPGGPLTGFGA